MVGGEELESLHTVSASTYSSSSVRDAGGAEEGPEGRVSQRQNEIGVRFKELGLKPEEFIREFLSEIFAFDDCGVAGDGVLARPTEGFDGVAVRAKIEDVGEVAGAARDASFIEHTSEFIATWPNKRHPLTLFGLAPGFAEDEDGGHSYWFIDLLSGAT